MAFAPIPEYEGKSPYVFITYAQQDEKIAYSIAVKMYNEGFRIWSSAACGNPSNMRIAERLSNSEVAMVFLSRSYLKYASYKEFEPRAVMNSPKQKIVICLDDTPIGTDWNTVDFPAGIRYNPDVPQGLWLRINSSDTLEKCRGAWPKVPMPTPYEEKPAVNVSVNRDELSDELTSLNSVMSSFGAGLDDEEIKNITLFQKNAPEDARFKWPEKRENTQEQEYYAIENLIDTAPMPSPEKKQYDSMIGLIESFMEKSSRAKEDELQKILSEPSESQKEEARLPAANTYGDYRPIPKNEFDKVDLAKDTASEPVVITHSSDIQKAHSAFTPVTVDHGDGSEPASYSMTRNGGRSERFSKFTYVREPVETPEIIEAPSKPVITPEPPAPIVIDMPEPPKKTEKKKEKLKTDTELFEKIVDDRKLMTSTEDNAGDARLTYHLGSLFDGFDEKDFIDDEEHKPEPPKPEPPKPEPKFEPVDHTPVRFKDDDIPLPALSFDKPRRPRPEPPAAPPVPAPAPRRTLSKPRRRYIVSVRKGVRHIEYENEMYEVNGRWIPGEIYHRLMPGAQYTAIRRISRSHTSQPAPAPAPAPVYRPPSGAALNSGSRLYNAVSTFFTPESRPARNSAETMNEELRSVLRERHELRRSEAIRQLEEENAAVESAKSTAKSSADTEAENAPARKHKFSHEGGIKKSLMANMETPVDTSAEESHRQYGARAEAASSAASEKSGKSGKKSKKADDKEAKKAAQKAAEKAAQKKAESKKKDKKKKDSKAETQAAEKETVKQPPRKYAKEYGDVDEDNLIELPKKNLPKMDYDPEAFRDMNLSEILFGDKGDGKKNSKKKKKK